MIRIFKITPMTCAQHINTSRCPKPGQAPASEPLGLFTEEDLFMAMVPLLNHLGGQPQGLQGERVETEPMERHGKTWFQISDFLLVLKKSHPMSKNATRLSVAEHLVAAWWFSRPHRCFTIWNPPSKIKHLKQIKRIMKPLLYFNIFTNKVL